MRLLLFLFSKGGYMGSKLEHKLKKKRRHERQIAEGIRVPFVMTMETSRYDIYDTSGLKPVPKKKVYLSELDRDDVKEVLRLVAGLSFV